MYAEVGKSIPIGLWFPGVESVQENIERRIIRGERELPEPSLDEIKKKLKEWFKQVFGVEKVSIRWSQKAGCTMCPCSPGYKISVKVTEDNKDLVRRIRRGGGRREDKEGYSWKIVIYGGGGKREKEITVPKNMQDRKHIFFEPLPDGFVWQRK